MEPQPSEAVPPDPLTGRLWWVWQEKYMKGEEMARVQRAWSEEPGIDSWVWDGDEGHQSTEMQPVDVSRMVQPSYVPELNPVERFFQELRQPL